MNTEEILRWFHRLFVIEVSLHFQGVDLAEFGAIADSGNEALNRKDRRGVIEAYHQLFVMLREARRKNAKK